MLENGSRTIAAELLADWFLAVAAGASLALQQVVNANVRIEVGSQ